jgi:Holliday junction DNA helicase RuvA
VGLGWSAATAWSAAVAEQLAPGEVPPVPVLLKQAIRYLGKVR